MVVLLALVELLEVVHAGVYFLWYRELKRFVGRPVAGSKDLDIEFDRVFLESSLAYAVLSMVFV